VHWSTEQLTI